MGLMEAIQRGKQPMPPRLMVYGIEGIGKSTLAADAPKPIFVQTEDGLGEIDCAKFPLSASVDDVLAALRELAAAQHDYETVVLDSLDWLERLIWDSVCREFHVASIEKADGGYQRGYVHALTHWRKVVDALATLRGGKGMVVILLAHARVEKFEDPETTTYDRYSPRLHKHACALLTEWCDGVLFATRKFRTEKEKLAFEKERTIAKSIGAEGGERVLRCVGSPACIAKNRFGLSAELPLSWPALFAGLTQGTQKGDVAHG